MLKSHYKNEIVEIAGHKVRLGDQKLIHLEVDRLPTGLLVEIPVFVFNGLEPGPTMLIQGGLHGDEVNSVELIRRMLHNKVFQITKGCVIVVPILNIFGFLSSSREVSGKDINRYFPGNKNGSLASRIAYYHTKAIAANIDFAIDFHTGGSQRNNFPQIRYTKGAEKGAELAQIFNAPFRFESKLIDKSFRKEAHKHGIPVIVYEGGESNRLDEHAIEVGIQGIKNILHHFGFLNNEEKIAKKESILLSKRQWLRAPNAGMFHTILKNGSSIQKGQIMGYVTDTYGKSATTIKAPYSGYIIAINHFPVIKRGDALYHVGRE